MSVPSALAAVPRFRACIGLGGNLGDVRAHLRAICMRMGVKGITGALRLTFQLTN